MTTPALNPTPSQRQQWEAHKARQARLWSSRPANTNIEAKPEVEAKPIKAKQIPLWQQTFIMFDTHVVAYRMWLVSEVNRLKAPPVVGEPRGRRSVVEIITEVLADYPGITIDDLKGPRRSRKLIVPRHIAMYEVHKQRPDLSYPQIGRAFGGRDHTSILSAVKKISAQREKEMKVSD